MRFLLLFLLLYIWKFIYFEPKIYFSYTLIYSLCTVHAIMYIKIIGENNCYVVWSNHNLTLSLQIFQPTNDENNHCLFNPGRKGTLVHKQVFKLCELLYDNDWVVQTSSAPTILPMILIYKRKSIVNHNKGDVHKFIVHCLIP